MYHQKLTLNAPVGTALYVWFEPWAEGVAFPTGSVVELHAQSAIEGQLEIDATPERTAVYGWPGSTLQVMVGGAVVTSFEQPVPDFLTPEMLSMLFGAPPKPTPQERARSVQSSDRLPPQHD